MAAWHILDVSRVSAQHGLRFIQMDCDPEFTRGFLILINSSGDSLRINIDLKKRLLSPADIDRLYIRGKLDLIQADYLKEKAGIELTKLVYTFA